MAGKPEDLEPKTEQVLVRLTRDQLRGLDLLRQPGESRPDVLRRLFMHELLTQYPDHYARLETLKLTEEDLERIIARRRDKKPDS